MSNNANNQQQSWTPGWPTDPPGSQQQPQSNAPNGQPAQNGPTYPQHHPHQHQQPAGPPPNGQNASLAPMPQQQQQQLPPMQPDYRLPPVQPMYGAHYPPGPPMGGYPPAQPAPRQRTAIACRYCRRRKIRCSGFENSEDGRCTNCQRFSQECVFTPVSAQTQAFVPAHTVWRGQNPPPNAQLYGAYGQPLPQPGRDPYQQQGPPPQQQQQQQQQPGQYPPPPPGYQQQPVYGQPPPQDAGRKRGTDEPHTPTLPPPNPGAGSHMGYANSDTHSNGGSDRPCTSRSSNYRDAGIQAPKEIIGGRERGS